MVRCVTNKVRCKLLRPIIALNASCCVSHKHEHCSHNPPTFFSRKAFAWRVPRSPFPKHNGSIPVASSAIVAVWLEQSPARLRMCLQPAIVLEFPLLPVPPEAPSLEVLRRSECQPHRRVSTSCCRLGAPPTGHVCGAIPVATAAARNETMTIV